MKHTFQTLKVVDRSSRKGLLNYYKKLLPFLLFGNLIGFLIAVLTKELLPLSAFILFIFISAFFFCSLYLDAIINDRLPNLNSEKIMLFKDSIVFKLIDSDLSNTIFLKQIETINTRIKGYDQGWRHFGNLSSFTNGNHNFLTIVEWNGNEINKEFYCNNESEIKRLRNNLSYYEAKGINSSIEYK